jgi:dolichyl-phosphate-mannose-protein mannosyltransferase
MSDSSAISTGRGLEAARSREFTLGATAILAGLALAKLLIHLWGIGRYGFFRDELYYIACGRHLAWGYIDQPPLVALSAWISQHIFGDSLAGFRVFPILVGAATVFFTGLLARQLGGGRFAQFLSATAVLFAPLILAFDSFLSMNAYEPLFWTFCALLAAGIVKGDSPKLWLAFGVAAGFGLENKHTMLVFGFGVVAGLLLSGEFQVFRSKWIWLGGLLALALFLPNLLWEARNGWPQIVVVRNAQEFKNTPIGPLDFLVQQILFVHPLALPLWLGGLAWLFFSKEGKRFRFLGWAYLIVLGIIMALSGKSYYPISAYPMLLAAGGVAFERFVALRGMRWLRIAYPAVLIAGGLLTVPFGVPVLPVGTFLAYSSAFPYAHSVKTERDATAALPQIYADMLGWENIATTVARVYHGLPESERAGCAILGGNYGEAGAIDLFGPRLGLPAAISGHNNYYLWGPRNYTGACVILFGERSEDTKKIFGDATLAATIANPLGMPSEQRVFVYICRKPSAPLSVLWPRFKLII